MEARLSGFESLAPAARGDAIKAVLTEVIGAGDATAAQVVLAHVLRESFPLTISRTVVAHFATELASAAAAPDILPVALRELQPRAASFADSDTAMRRQYADVLCESGKYISAARVLARINLDASGRTASADDKCNLYVKIAEYFLEEGDTVSAEQYIKKASEFIHSVGDAHLALRFRVCYARVQDSQKKFLEASLKYYTLSQIQDDTIAQDDILTLLFSALTCACLAKAGPQRSRIMDTLHRDARTPMVDGFFMLDKMYKGEIVRKEEVERFRELLLPHHVADLPGGLTVYDRAIVQHNLLAASRVYESVSFDGLGTLLSIDPRKAEKIAATMIVEGRLQGSIDQVDDMLLFESDKEALKSWDVRLQRLCGAVASCAAEVEKVIGEPTNA